MARRQLRLKRPKRKRRKLKIPPFRTLRCPMVGHQATWCRCLCTPHNGVGVCGRPALHGMLGRTQLAILAFKKRRETA